MMRREFRDDKLFQPLGRVTLSILASLLVVGWLLAAKDVLVTAMVGLGATIAAFKAVRTAKSA